MFGFVRMRFGPACFLLLAALPAQATEISGRALVIDGDTLTIGETHIRLEGIDAPETDQICLDAKGARWNCGITARDRLAERLKSKSISCADKGRDKYGRTLGLCKAGGEDINAWMVREGLALAFVHYSQAYVADEAKAKEGRRGLWAGAFIAPWEWRHRDHGTTVLGAVSVPVGSQSLLLASTSASAAPSPECAIKGNVNRQGERIYHLPGTKAYAQTRMDKGTGERWFCSEVEAEAAGWRRAGR